MSANYQYQVGAVVKTVGIERQGDELRVTIGDTTYQVTARSDHTGQVDLTIDGQRFSVYTASDHDGYYIWLGGKSWRLQHSTGQPRSSGGANASTGSLITAMPGLVTQILVQEGDLVKRGDALVILEAMKMEQRIAAPHDGRVSKIACTVGQVAQPGEVLVQIRAG